MYVFQVSVPKGSLCNLNVEVDVGLPPDAVYNIVIDPDNKRVFKNIKVSSILLFTLHVLSTSYRINPFLEKPASSLHISHDIMPMEFVFLSLLTDLLYKFFLSHISFNHHL